jgi:hypothetical protein
VDIASLLSGPVPWASYPRPGAFQILFASSARICVTVLYQAQGVMNRLLIGLYYVNLFYFSHTIKETLSNPG